MGRLLSALFALLLISSPAWAEIKWDSGYSANFSGAGGHTAVRLGSGWKGISTDTPVSGLKCAEINITSKSSSVIVGAVDDATYKSAVGFTYVGNSGNDVGQQDGGNYYVNGPGGPNSPNTFSFTTGFLYVCLNTAAHRMWVSKNLVTYWGNGSTGNAITAATVASTPTSGIDYAADSPTFPTYFAVSCDAACTVVFNGGYQAFNTATALPSGFTTAESLVASTRKTSNVLLLGVGCEE